MWQGISFEKTIVDVEDVFAVGYTSDYRLKSENEQLDIELIIKLFESVICIFSENEI